MSDNNSPIQNNPKRNNFQIVIAEDDVSIANLLKLQLEIAGYKVEVANSGNQAVKTILQLKPSFILMDINMPELNGFEVIDELKKQDYDTRSFKLIFLSNSSTTGDITKAQEYSAGYKIKAELSPKELIDVIDSTLLS